MIRCGNQIRLTQDDVDRLSKLAGVSPHGICTVDDLNSFVDRHLSNYDNSTPESILLSLLLANEKLTPQS